MVLNIRDSLDEALVLHSSPCRFQTLTSVLQWVRTLHFTLMIVPQRRKPGLKLAQQCLEDECWMTSKRQPGNQNARVQLLDQVIGRARTKQAGSFQALDLDVRPSYQTGRCQKFLVSQIRSKMSVNRSRREKTGVLITRKKTFCLFNLLSM